MIVKTGFTLKSQRIRMKNTYFQIGGFTIQVNSDIPIKSDTFHPKFNQFRVHGAGEKNIVINHHFDKQIDAGFDETDRIYFKKPWAVYNKDEKIIYEWVSADGYCLRKIITNKEHTVLDIYHDLSIAKEFREGLLHNITLLPTDQILLCRVFGFNQGCLLHSTGLIFKDNGYLFIGHSGAGKTTIARIMKNDATVLCDDRNIIRKIKNQYRLYGTWRHSDFTKVSSLSAPLKGIFFLKQSQSNYIKPIKDNKKSFFLIMDHLVRALVTQDWMTATMDSVEDISKNMDCFYLNFDKSGKIKKLIHELQSGDY